MKETTLGMRIYNFLSPVKDRTKAGRERYAWRNLQWSGKFLYVVSFVLIGLPVAVLSLLLSVASLGVLKLLRPVPFSVACVVAGIIFYVRIDVATPATVVVGLLGVTLCGMALRFRWHVHDQKRKKRGV